MTNLPPVSRPTSSANTSAAAEDRVEVQWPARWHLPLDVGQVAELDAATCADGLADPGAASDTEARGHAGLGQELTTIHSEIPFLCWSSNADLSQGRWRGRSPLWLAVTDFRDAESTDGAVELAPMPDQWVRCLASSPIPTTWIRRSSAVAVWTDAGKSVAYLLVTRGEAGIDGIAPVDAGRLRVAEQRAACDAVGVESLEFLDHADGVIEYGLPLRQDLALAIRRHRPELVVTLNHRDASPAGR